MFYYYEGTEQDTKWNVKTLQKLNDCAKDVVGWTLGAKLASGGETDKPEVQYKAGGSDVCYGLTASFTGLTSGRSY